MEIIGTVTRIVLMYEFTTNSPEHPTIVVQINVRVRIKYKEKKKSKGNITQKTGNKTRRFL